MQYTRDLETARNKFAQNQKLLKSLKRTKTQHLDFQFHRLHEEVFEEIDCLICANCCSTTSPIFISSDIARLARSLKMRAAEFIKKYLKIDDEGDYVLHSSPCPFLGEDNKCIVYADRPRACKDYPHTNRKRMHQITELTLKNTLVCPAVARIVERLK